MTAEMVDAPPVVVPVTAPPGEPVALVLADEPAVVEAPAVAPVVEDGRRVPGAVLEVWAVTSGTWTGIKTVWRGSWALLGLGCGCVARAVRWAWDQASDDPQAAAALAKYTKRHAALVKKLEAADEDDDVREAALEELGGAPLGRRPLLESLGYIALGGLLAVGAGGMATALITSHLGVLVPWEPLIVSVGGAAWIVSAWRVAPPLSPAPGKGEGEGEDNGQDVVEDEDQEDGQGLLLWHVVEAVADAESAGRAGVHLDVVLQSATAAGLIVPDTELAALRTWVEGTGLPTVDKLGMRIGGKPVTRVGLRVDATSTALGMSPLALVQDRAAKAAEAASAAPAGPVGETPADPPAAPAKAVGEPPAGTPPQTPAKAPAKHPVAAALSLIPGRRQAPAKAPSPTLSQEKPPTPR
ncbi:hypothetical protein ACFYPN_32500 [Streptomyces sp. NPDC005576]|uniref:hypothetical protein n=1 Tax=Streptomyces sp. NPDC005576 TaxID=3364726 RepID=UPI0036919099